MELKHLTERQAHIALISIHTAITTTDVEGLKKVFADALDFGMTINERRDCAPVLLRGFCSGVPGDHCVYELGE